MPTRAVMGDKGDEKMATKFTHAELMQQGKRAVRKGECVSVIVAPDHTGEDNYHNCTGSVHHETDGSEHYCGCRYSWKDSGEITEMPAGEPNKRCPGRQSGRHHYACVTCGAKPNSW